MLCGIRFLLLFPRWRTAQVISGTCKASRVADGWGLFGACQTLTSASAQRWPSFGRTLSSSPDKERFIAAEVLLLLEPTGTNRNSWWDHRGKVLWEETGSERRELLASDHLVDSSRALFLWAVLKICEWTRHSLVLGFQLWTCLSAAWNQVDEGYCISWRKEDLTFSRSLETKAVLLSLSLSRAAYGKKKKDPR